MNEETFEDRVNAFLAHVNQLTEKYWQDQEYKFSPSPLRKAVFGDKWVKVYTYERSHDGTERQTCIYAFIVREDNQTKTLGNLVKGDIHKPASYKLPAKHARGNIFQDDFNNCAGPNGIVYLR